MEVDCDLPAAGCSETIKPSEHVEFHSEDNIFIKEFKEYPVFMYKAFVFRPIALLLQEDVKATDHIKTVGRCCSESFDELYLEDVSPHVPAKIFLRFDCTDAVPKVGENVEVFGCVQRKAPVDVGEIPVFQVWFFRSCRGNVPRYIRTLSRVAQMLDKDG